MKEKDDEDILMNDKILENKMWKIQVQSKREIIYHIGVL